MECIIGLIKTLALTICMKAAAFQIQSLFVLIWIFASKVTISIAAASQSLVVILTWNIVASFIQCLKWVKGVMSILLDCPKYKTDPHITNFSYFSFAIWNKFQIRWINKLWSKKYWNCTLLHRMILRGRERWISQRITGNFKAEPPFSNAKMHFQE